MKQKKHANPAVPCQGAIHGGKRGVPLSHPRPVDGTSPHHPTPCDSCISESNPRDPLPWALQAYINSLQSPYLPRYDSIPRVSKLGIASLLPLDLGLSSRRKRSGRRLPPLGATVGRSSLRMGLSKVYVKEDRSHGAKRGWTPRED